jgi:hypothetical protein
LNANFVKNQDIVQRKPQGQGEISSKEGNVLFTYLPIVSYNFVIIKTLEVIVAEPTLFQQFSHKLP